MTGCVMFQQMFSLPLSELREKTTPIISKDKVENKNLFVFLLLLLNDNRLLVCMDDHLFDPVVFRTWCINCAFHKMTFLIPHEDRQ